MTPERRLVKLSDIQPGPIQHESLPPELLAKIKTLYEMVGHYTCPNLEAWEIGFMRDITPEREVGVWARIALGWKKYHENFLNNKLLSDNEERELVGILIGLSMGQEKNQVTRVYGMDVVERLWQCYSNPIEGK